MGMISNVIDLIMSEHPCEQYFENKVNHFSKKPCYNDIRKWALNVTSEATELQFALMLIALVQVESHQQNIKYSEVLLNFWEERNFGPVFLLCFVLGY